MVQAHTSWALRDGALTILALDPGGTTGFAYYMADVTNTPDGKPEFFKERWNRGHLGPGAHHKGLYDFLGYMQVTNYIIVCESFEYRHNPKDQQRENIVLDSKEYIGIVKLFFAERMLPLEWHHPLVFQTASEGKGFWFPQKDSTKLKKVGLYSPNMIHANDATAHLLHFMSFKMKRNDLFEKLQE